MDDRRLLVLRAQAPGAPHGARLRRSARRGLEGKRAPLDEHDVLGEGRYRLLRGAGSRFSPGRGFGFARARNRSAEKRWPSNEKQLGIWAEICPENYRDRYALVSAEIARIDGDPQRASELYEQAIRAARESGFVHTEGLAYEQASLFCRARSLPLIADAYLREARACYLRWGAEGKVRADSTAFIPNCFRRRHRRRRARARCGPSSSISFRSSERPRRSRARFDQATLLRTLLKVVLEHGGARTARLILVRGDG